ncbi:MAG TPA: type II toxin-antitoxin system VapC family toxin [Acetobacteraceae bacterium]|jgi:predicted nucleic acid-binding protein
MPICVLDASVAIAAVIEGEQSDAAHDILREVIGDSAAVPPLWFFEVGNVLLLAERRRSLTAAARLEHLDDLSRLPITVDHEGTRHAWRETMALADRHRLTLYDAAYLELCLRLGLPLASFDAALRTAAKAANVLLL